MQHQLGNDGLTRWKERVLAHTKKRGMHYTVHHNRSGCIFSLSLPKEKPIPLDKKTIHIAWSIVDLPVPDSLVFLTPPLPLLRFPRCDLRAKEKEEKRRKKDHGFLADSRARVSLAQNLLLLFPHLVGRNGVIVRR